MQKIDFIVPGETDAEVPASVPARWFVKCPSCGGMHGVTFTKYWNEDAAGNQDEKPTEHWCFICPADGIHFQLDDKPPYRVLKELPYRAAMTAVTDSADLDGDELAKYFE